MPVPLKLLVLEDNESEAMLLLKELTREGFKLDWRRVQTEADYLACLTPDIDIILSDFNMPQFDASRALALLNERGYDIPFIVVTGTISEEVAVETMRQGAADYLLKDRLGRLGQAVTRELKDKKSRAEKREAAAELRRSEERYRFLISNIPDITWTADRNGRIVFVSPNAVRIHGYTAEEIYEMANASLFAMARLEDVSRLLQQYEELFSLGTPFDVEYQYRLKDGQWKWVHDRAMATFLKDGVPYAYGVMTDITQRKELEAQLVQSQRMEAVGRLAGGVAHDFNNLLTVIIGYSDLLSIQFDQSDPKLKWLQEIRKAGNSAASLTRQLLAFSRRQLLEPRVLNLNEVVADIQKMLTRLIGEDVTLTTRLGRGLSSVKADPGQIEQVIMNLVVNARDAMPRGGKLTIETAHINVKGGTKEHAANHHNPNEVPEGPYVMVAVSDTGTGVAPAIQARIFEPFFTTKEVGKGTGLGLSTVYGIVQQSGGHIKVFSELGKGTTFAIYLPMIQGLAEPLRGVAEREESPKGAETILLVEDDSTVRDLAQSVLEMQGYKVLPVPGGNEALALEREHPEVIHVLLTDTVMPEMSGPEVAARLKVLRPAIKVILMSGYTDESLTRGDVLKHVNGFLQKPFTPRDLVRKVRGVIDNRASGYL